VCVCVSVYVCSFISTHTHTLSLSDSDSTVRKTARACSTLVSASAMLTVVLDVKMITQSVPMSSFNSLNGTSAGQCTWRCSLPAKFIDSMRDLMALKRMSHTTHDGHHHN